MKCSLALRRSTVLAVTLGWSCLAIPPAFAQNPAVAAASPWCGTSQAAAARQEALHRVIAAGPRGPHALATAATVRKVNGIYVVTSDASVLAFDHPFDLKATSLQFRRTDDHSFEVSRVAPRFDHNLGQLTHTFTSGDQPAFPLDLQGFAFPFGSHDLTRLYLTPTNAILTTPVMPAVSGQQNGLDAVSRQQAMISPLFVPAIQGDDGRNMKLFLRQETDSLLITWISNDSYPVGPRLWTTYSYEVQARLSRNGDIDHRSSG